MKQRGGESRRCERKPMTEVARRLRHKMTSAEQIVWGAVRAKQCGGLRFLRQHDVGPYVLDFYCASARLAIEIDGAIHDDSDVAERDQNREATLLTVFGIRVIRLTNEFVFRNAANSLHDHLLKAINAPQNL